MAKDAAKPFAFVAMCFDSRLQSIYFKVVKPVLEEYGFECWRGDEFLEPGVIVDQLKQKIETSDLVLCDLTFDNANVFYELGVAHALCKATLLISQTASSIPFNVAHLRAIPYEDSRLGLLDLRDRLVRTLREIAPADPEMHVPRVDHAEPLPMHQINETEVQREALYSPNAEFIRYAVRYLGESGDTVSFERIRQVAQTSYSPPDLVRDALDALWSINQHDALEPILEAARRHGSHLVRERAVLLLANYKPGRNIKDQFQYPQKTLLDAIQERLADESWGVRRSACEVLGRWGDPRAITALRGARSDAVAEVSLAAHEALKRIRELQSKPAVDPVDNNESTEKSPA
jgi:hypothetical protein